MVLEGDTLSPLAMQREVDGSLPRRAYVYTYIPVCVCVHARAYVHVLSRWRQMRYGCIVGTVCLGRDNGPPTGPSSRNGRRRTGCTYSRGNVRPTVARDSQNSSRFKVQRSPRVFFSSGVHDTRNRPVTIGRTVLSGHRRTRSLTCRGVSDG